MFWCRSYSSLDCTDPQLRHDCCHTCSSPLSTPITTSLPVASTWHDVTVWTWSTADGRCLVEGGDSASFCATMPTHECYYFPRLCCGRCDRHYTGIPGRPRDLLHALLAGSKNLFCVPMDELLWAKDDLLSEGGQSLNSIFADCFVDWFIGIPFVGDDV